MVEYTRRRTLKGIGAVGATLLGAGCTAVDVNPNEDPNSIESDIREDYSAFTEIDRDSVDVAVEHLRHEDHDDGDVEVYAVTATAQLQRGGKDICSYGAEERYALVDRLEIDAMRLFNGLYDHYGGNSEDADDRDGISDVVELYAIRFEDETGAATVDISDGTADRIAMDSDDFDMDDHDHVANFKHHFRRNLTPTC